MPKPNRTKEGRIVRVPEDIVRMAKLIDAVTNEGIGKIIASAAQQSLAKKLKELDAQGHFSPHR